MKNFFTKILLIVIAASMGSCYGTRYLQKNEYLLRYQSIEGNQNFTDDELSVFIKQKPNSHFLGIMSPYVYIHYTGKRYYDKSKIEQKITKISNKYDQKVESAKGKKRKERLKQKKERKIDKKELALEKGNTLMRWGEPVAVYDEEKAKSSETQMELYLHTKGYFEAKVTHQVLSMNYAKKIANTKYLVEEGRPHIIDSLSLICNDSMVTHIYNLYANKTLIKKGNIYSQEVLSKERDRIEDVLKNNGYFAFSKQYIRFRIDTLSAPYKVTVTTMVQFPEHSNANKQFYLDSINFTTDANIRFSTKRQTVEYNDIVFRYFINRFSKRILHQRVLLEKGKTYSKKKAINTQLQIANLNNFKFVNINFDSTGGKFIANIFASPLDKYQTTHEVGVNVNDGLPGPFYNLSFTNRNIFGGLENLELSGYVGFEGVVSPTSSQEVYRNLEGGGKISVIFPRFLFPLSSTFIHKQGQYNPKTTWSVGLAYANRNDYERLSIYNKYSYSWQSGLDEFYNLSLFDFNIINTTNMTDEFRELLKEQGKYLQSSFDPSFVSSISLSANYNFNRDASNSSILKAMAESGGLMFNFWEPPFVKDNNLEYFQYVKGSVDYRKRVALGENKVFASRIALGLAIPYGYNHSLPYEKYFFSGGSNSIRAWSPRRLGPGSFNSHRNETADGEDLPNDYSNKREQPGDIQLEGSIEYRAKLIGFIEWALFVDAGNIWTFSEVKDNAGNKIQGTNFDFNRFYKEIAVGTGIGLRLNFSFLIVRFDYGLKAYDPSLSEGKRFILDNYFKRPLFNGVPGQSILNIAIGYPF